jgi:membrane protease YdiL (CAAX protease family)
VAPATDNPPYRSNLALIGLFVFLVIALSLALSALAWPLVNLSWWKTFRRCVSIAAALSLWIVIKRVERRSLRSYGFSNVATGGRELLLGLGLGLLGLCVMLGLGLMMGFCQIALSPNRLKLWTLLIGFLPAALLVGVLEEFVFRGFLLQRLMGYSKWIAVIGSSAAYALVHLKSPEVSALTYLELGGLFLLGWLLSLSYLKTRQLFMAVGLHAMLAYGSRVNKLIVSFPNVELSWLTGTSRLVNGLLGWGILLALGWIVAVAVKPSKEGRQ